MSACLGKNIVGMDTWSPHALLENYIEVNEAMHNKIPSKSTLTILDRRIIIYMDWWTGLTVVRRNHRTPQLYSLSRQQRKKLTHESKAKHTHTHKIKLNSTSINSQLTLRTTSSPPATVPSNLAVVAPPSRHCRGEPSSRLPMSRCRRRRRRPCRLHPWVSCYLLHLLHLRLPWPPSPSLRLAGSSSCTSLASRGSARSWTPWRPSWSENH